MKLLFTLSCIFLTTVTVYSVQDVCTEGNHKCVFPYEYNDNQYNSCLPSSSYGKKWCGIVHQVNDSTDTYDYCIDKCPSTIRCTENGRKCLFPFLYGGKNVTSCLRAAWWKGSYEWCAIESEFKNAGKGIDWDTCVDECPVPTNSDTIAEPTIPITTEQPTTPKTTAEPTIPKTIAEPTIPITTEQPTTPKTIAEPTIPKTTAEPTTPKTIAEPIIPKTTEQPTTPKTIAEPTIPKTTAEPTITKTIPEPIIPKTTEQPTTPKTIAEPTIPKTTAEPTMPKTTAEPTTPKTVAEPTIPITTTQLTNTIPTTTTPTTKTTTTTVQEEATIYINPSSERVNAITNTTSAKPSSKSDPTAVKVTKMVSITSAGTMKDNTDHDVDNNFGRSYPGNTTSTSIPDTKTTHDQHNGIMIALIVFSVILFLAIVCTAAKLYLKRRVKSNENIDRKNDAEVAIPLTTTNRSNGEMRKEASSEEEKLQPEVRCIVDSGFISNNSDGAQS